MTNRNQESHTFAVLTISDTCYKEPNQDRSGPRLKILLKEMNQNASIYSAILPDECELIQSELVKLVNRSVQMIITTGGTGFAPRDVTPEATKPVLEKECPQLSTAIALASLQKTKFAALTRGVCGIAQKTLIINFPGSEKAVIECFDYVRDILPHALQLIRNDLPSVRNTHSDIQNSSDTSIHLNHVCPHRVGAGDANDRNSTFPMVPVMEALEIIFQTINPIKVTAKFLEDCYSNVDIPPFRASIKDGYAMKSGFSGSKKVIGYISAGDKVYMEDFGEDECFKINTGAPLPHFASCVVQVEDTKLLKTKKDGLEDLVEILIEPIENLDVRPIGCDLRKGTKVFPSVDHSPVVIKSVLASVGQSITIGKPKIAIISTGSELLTPGQPELPGKIYDSNTIMLEQLLNYFGFDCAQKIVLTDDFETVTRELSKLFDDDINFVICSGGVSMGDKDYIKPVLKSLGFNIEFGRVNMKPGKPMTFAHKPYLSKYFFGLPGNPVSSFVCFHLFVLPALRWSCGWERNKCNLAKVTVTLQNDKIPLDPRPEYARATITNKNGHLYALVDGNQMSSRLQSIVGADVLIHLPAKREAKSSVIAGEKLWASVLRYDFISSYE